MYFIVEDNKECIGLKTGRKIEKKGFGFGWVLVGCGRSGFDICLVEFGLSCLE